MNKLVVGNLKMNLVSPEEREKYIELCKREIKGKKLEKIEMVLCPPFVHLENFSKKLPKKIFLGAQDCFSEEKGSYTGEISPSMLKNLGCEFVILGHSERRRFQGETEEEIGLKVSASLKAGLSPIICIGENIQERESGEFAKIIAEELLSALSNLKPVQLEKIVVAYEPIWSVGTDVVPASNDIMGAKLLIRKVLIDNFGKKYGNLPRIIYGGSVSSKTVEAVCIKSDMDGVLVGRESLFPGEFMRIAEIIDKN